MNTMKFLSMIIPALMFCISITIGGKGGVRGRPGARGGGGYRGGGVRPYYSSSRSSGGGDIDPAVALIVVVLCVIFLVCLVVTNNSGSGGGSGYGGGKIKNENYSPPPTVKEWLKRDKVVILETNPNYTSEGVLPQYKPTVFVDGQYNGFYTQYKQSHDIPSFTLRFDGDNVSGFGSDEVGKYNITGHYNEQNNRMAITQSYIHGTGNPTENLGHNVSIRLQWNEAQQKFEGKWYCVTHLYKGTGMWYISKM
eukprot:410659_1